MTEMYSIQRYLQHDRLQEMDIGHLILKGMDSKSYIQALQMI